MSPMPGCQTQVKLSCPYTKRGWSPCAMWRGALGSAEMRLELLAMGPRRGAGRVPKVLEKGGQSNGRAGRLKTLWGKERCYTHRAVALCQGQARHRGQGPFSRRLHWFEYEPHTGMYTTQTTRPYMCKQTTYTQCTCVHWTYNTQIIYIHIYTNYTCTLQMDPKNTYHIDNKHVHSLHKQHVNA